MSSFRSLAYRGAALDRPAPCFLPFLALRLGILARRFRDHDLGLTAFLVVVGAARIADAVLAQRLEP
jgi:hypothetical protein